MNITKQEEIVNKILLLRPGAYWNLSGPTYENLEWLDDSSTKPTAQELGL